MPKQSLPKSREPFPSVAREQNLPETGLSAMPQPGLYGVATWDWDLLNGICSYSPEWARILQCRDEDLAGRDNWSWWSGRMHMDDMPHMSRSIADVTDGLATRKEELFRLKRGDGHWIWILSRGEVTAWAEDGKPARMAGIALDVTQLRESEHFGGQTPAHAGHAGSEHGASLSERRLNALYQLIRMDRASEAEVLHFVLDSMRQLTDSEYSFLFFPDTGDIGGTGRLLRIQSLQWFTREDLRGERVPEALLPLLTEETATPKYHALYNGAGKFPLTVLYEGRLPVLRCLVVPGMEGERVAFLAGVCNKPEDYAASDLQQIEIFVNGVLPILRGRHHLESLRQAKDAAESAKTAIAEFLANVNHELRTPLTSILGYAETMAAECADDDLFAKRCLETIQRQAARMHSLVNDLLQLSRFEGSDMPLERNETFLGELVDEVAEFMASKMEARRQCVDNAVPRDLAVRVDSHMVSQVVRNLVENASRYAPQGTVIHIDAVRERDAVRVFVRDHGPGIPPDELTRVFERFYRSRQNDNRHSSTGIGLAICKHAIERHGGRIWAENACPGARICFTLPVREE